uniref:Uncharacterized protein n=1 Tax=Ditylenchus dipsaci TaxID=166011 RepID=A0A915ERF6_9BILA
MSLIWKIVLQGEDVSGFLFTKSSTTEAKCNVCSKSFQRLTKVLEEIENTEQLKKAALQKGLSKFVIHGKERTISVTSDARFKDRLARNNLKFNSA